MSHLPDEFQSFLFAYIQDNSDHLWVYDGNLYHRFVWNTEEVRFIRSQPYLPKYTIGQILCLNDAQRKALESEAAWYDLFIPFFVSEEECIDYSLTVRHDQLIFGQTSPGGYFYLNNGMKRSRKSKGEQT
jgi:hypothetical protein